MLIFKTAQFFWSCAAIFCSCAECAQLRLRLSPKQRKFGEKLTQCLQYFNLIPTYSNEILCSGNTLLNTSDISFLSQAHFDVPLWVLVFHDYLINFNSYSHYSPIFENTTWLNPELYARNKVIHDKDKWSGSPLELQQTTKIDRPTNRSGIFFRRKELDQFSAKRKSW